VCIHEAAEVLTSKVTMKLGMTDCGRISGGEGGEESRVTTIQKYFLSVAAAVEDNQSSLNKFW
jgi:hypothetical protein